MQALVKYAALQRLSLFFSAGHSDKDPAQQQTDSQKPKWC